MGFLLQAEHEEIALVGSHNILLLPAVGAHLAAIIVRFLDNGGNLIPLQLHIECGNINLVQSVLPAEINIPTVDNTGIGAHHHTMGRSYNPGDLGRLGGQLVQDAFLGSRPDVELTLLVARYDQLLATVVVG